MNSNTSVHSSASKLVQGDVVLRRVGSLPTGLNPVSAESGGLVVQYSETTGHHHHFRGSDANKVRLYVGKKSTDARFTTITEDIGKYLVVDEEIQMFHGKGFQKQPYKTGAGDHNVLTIQPGTYKVCIVREYDYNSGEIALVRD